MFKLIIEIGDNLETTVNFEGEKISHIVLAGVLETIKHSMLNTAEILNSNPQEQLAPQKPGDDNAPTE